MRSIKTFAVLAVVAIAGSFTVNAAEMQDTRKLIKLPPEIESKMLINMRDHIAALDDVISAVQEGAYDKAGMIAESRLGWSSLVRRGDQEVASHWVAPMQKMADAMYRAASDFVIVAQNASVEDNKEGYKKMLGALNGVTSACRGCHEAFRVR